MFKNWKLLLTLVFAVLFLGAFVSINQVQAATSYPIPELGNCQSQRECFLYCEVPAHKATCWSYSVYGPQVLADETSEQKVEALGITFPIAELGGCTDLVSCKNYCDQEENQTACQEFAQSSGLAQKEQLIEKASQELGCTSKEECRLFCAQETNQEACSAFARRYSLKGASKDKLLQVAEQQLGCNSHETCKLACDQEENKPVCQRISQQVNPNSDRREELVQKAKDQLGCNSFEECKAFCQDTANIDKCRNFGQAVSSGTKVIRENGDCTTPEECRQVCAENPERCPNFPNQTRPATDSTRIQDARLQNGNQQRVLDQNLRRTTGASSSGNRIPPEFPPGPDRPRPTNQPNLQGSQPVSVSPRPLQGLPQLKSQTGF